jgi:hypothetical protein
MAPTHLVLDRPITSKFTMGAALDELLWIDTQLKYYSADSQERKELLGYRNFVESHTEVPQN